MIAVEQDVQFLTVDGMDSSCRDACGDEDNCCEFGFDKMPMFNTVTLKELVR